MKFPHLKIVAVAFCAILCACSQSPEKLKAQIEANPDIVLGALEKNPAKFAEVMQKANVELRRINQEKQAQAQGQQIEEEMKNPKKVAFDGRAIRGKKDAPILIVEYSDFECPFCSRGFNTVEELRKKYGDKMLFVFKHLPLNFHPMAMPAAKRFEALAMQSSELAYKFHDELFQNQGNLKQGEKWMDEVAKKIGGDVAKMKKDMESAAVKQRIDADMAEANSFGIRGTPGFVVNGITVRGALPPQHFEDIITKRPTYN